MNQEKDFKNIFIWISPFKNFKTLKTKEIVKNIYFSKKANKIQPETLRLGTV